MLMSQILPESSYKFNELSREEVKTAFDQGRTITGRVEKISSRDRELLVRLGDGLFAHLPLTEVTIYPFQYSKNPNRVLPINVCILLGKNVRVKVTEVTENNIVVSRKQNMMQAYEHLATCKSAMFHVTNLTAFTAFGDIGDGIVARIKIREVCRARIRNVAEFLHKGDTKRVILLNSDDDMRFEASYRRTFKEFKPEDFPENMAVQGVINEAVNESASAYFVTVSPQVSGIMNVLSWHPQFHYGDKVECTVTKSYAKGLNLNFLKLID